MRDLADGYSLIADISMLNQVLTRMMANFDQDARIEGILNRFEQFGSDSPQQSQ